MGNDLKIERIRVTRNGIDINVFVSGHVFGFDEAKRFVYDNVGKEINRDNLRIRIMWDVKYEETVTDASLRAKLWDTVKEFVCDRHPASCALLRLEGSGHKVTPEGLFIVVDPLACSILSNEKIAGEIGEFLETMFGRTVPVSITAVETDPRAKKEAAKK
ncbi:MAG: hypothetical protein J5921_04785, partial [Clostridia bacterium]|nr:hypothetical protein [Clostridia bacterium]